MRAARAAVFGLVTAFVWSAPAYVQLFHGPIRWLRPWAMFSGAGLDATEVRFVERLPDGSDRPLDRYELLATTPAQRAALAKVRDEAAARKLGRRMCKAIGEGADVRAYMRIATRQGWKRVLRAKENLCAG